MRDFEQVLSERASEIAIHLDFIKALEAAATGRSTGMGLPQVEAEPLNILKSGFLVHLYNVVEAVMAKILEEIAISAAAHPPKTWCDGLLKEWAKGRVNLERDLTIFQAEGRVFDLLKETAERQALGTVRIKRKTGNWSHVEIESVANAVGCDLQISAAVRKKACDIVFENDLPPLKYIRDKRNRLAHGSESFVDGARHIPADRLKMLQNPVINYMEDIATSFSSYLDEDRFLVVVGA
jgi:hypothetical protein